MDNGFTETTKLNVEELQELVDNNQRYLCDKYRMISDYRREREINNDYKGRQIFELIQNADDAGSKYVNIELNSDTCKLIIENEGEPFTLAGYRSLMISHLSTKRKKKYIGNKGLGFRSVLNWSRKILISSGGCNVIFSVENAKRKFLELYPSEIDRHNILTEFEYSVDTIPFPIFALPIIENSQNEHTITSIEIDFHPDAREEIENQISALRKEVLLFLNNVEKIRITINDEINEFSSVRKDDTISIDKQTWKIFDNKVNGEDPLLPSRYRNTETNEDESYSIKIAVQKGLKDDVNKLFSFFPTKIGLQFPMIIHGTFELDSSRNSIIETTKNKFLVDKLVDLIFKVSDSFFGNSATWDRIRLLNYKGNKNLVLEEFGFYDAIDRKIKTISILPCIDDNYRSFENIRFHTNEFSEMIVELHQQKYFPELLQKIPQDLSVYIVNTFPNIATKKYYTYHEFKTKVEFISKEIYRTVSMDSYAKWIVSFSRQFTICKEYFTILVNQNGDLIDSNNTIFTPPSKNVNLKVPSHVKIDFINSNLFEHLAKEFNIFDDNDRARKLKDKLDFFVNIQSFEPAPVLTKIVNETNKIVNSSDNIIEKQGFVKAMLRSLFDYFVSSNRAKDSQIRTNNIPVININGDIIYSKDSFLSNYYLTGRVREEILGELYENQDLVAPTNLLGLNEVGDIESFLVDFLGVNKFLKLERVDEKIYSYGKYLDFIYNNKLKPDKFRKARLSYTCIQNLELIEKKLRDKTLTVEKLAAWICMDNDIRESLRTLSDVDFRYEIANQTHNSFSNKLYEIPSYIKFQLSSLGLFDDYLLNDLGIPIINVFQFDFNDEIFRKKSIDSTIIKETLIQLGAKTDFIDLSIERVEVILKSLPFTDAPGKYARKIYQAAIERFKHKKEYLKNISGLTLHSTKEKTKQYLPYNEVYYINNIALPRKIITEKAILNYPKRSGEQNVSDFFEVQTIADFNYTANSYTANDELTSELNSYLKQIKPFVLVYRLQKLKSESDIRDAVKIVKSITIILCTELILNFDGKNSEAEEYDFVSLSNEKNTFLIKYFKPANINVLKQDSDLSDVITEIFSISFDITNIWEETRSIFRNDIKDTQHQIIDKFGEESLLNAKSKLEITVEELDFWKPIYLLKNMQEKFPNVDDEIDFRKTISNDLSLEKSHLSQIDYFNLNSFNNLEKIKIIFHELKISLQDFNKHSTKELSFYDYHIKSLEIIMENLKYDFINELWKKNSDGNIENQKLFTRQIASFNSKFIDSIALECKYKIDVDYTSKIKEKIKFVYEVILEENMKVGSPYLTQFEQNKDSILLTNDEIDSLSEEDRSLLYFKIDLTELDRIKSFFLTNADNVETSKDFHVKELQESTDSPHTKNLENLVPINKSRNESKPPHNVGNYRGSHTSLDDKMKKDLGKKSEEDVLLVLIQKYGSENVVWLSGYSNHPERSDSWGYDIKYREDKNSEWQFVEVKSFYNGNFYFTKTELRFAKKNPNKYYFYLVEENKILTIIFSNLLEENGELNYNNDYFNIEVKDYKFTRI